MNAPHPAAATPSAAPPLPFALWQPRSRHDPQPTLADTERRDVPWLWPRRIPIGRVTLLVGDPGVGKSLVALDIAARVSTGNSWPDASNEENDEIRMTNDEPRHSSSDIRHSSFDLRHSPGELRQSPPDIRHSSFELPHSAAELRHSPPDIRHSSFELRHSPSSVLLLSAEDDPADTIRPRLEALGADLARIIALPPDWSPADPAGLADAPTRLAALWSATTRPRPLDLCRDVAALEDLIVRQGGARLVIIDPLTAYLGGNIENTNGAVRQVLRQLGAMAARRGLAVLGICHLRKERGSALHRTMGSLAFAAAARAAWLVARDPGDAERRLLLPMKNNLGQDASGLAFTIASAGPDGSPAVHWAPEPVTLAANDALNPPKPQRECAPRAQPEFDDAVRWLQQALAAGVQPSRRIESHAAAHGIRTITLRRAFRHLGGEAVRTGFGPLGLWHWRLPSVGPQDPPKEDDPFLRDW